MPLVPVGEGAVKDGQDDGRRRVRRKNTPEGSDEEDEDEPSQPTQTQTQKKKGNIATSMQVDNDEGDENAPRRRSGRR